MSDTASSFKVGDRVRIVNKCSPQSGLEGVVKMGWYSSDSWICVCDDGLHFDAKGEDLALVSLKEGLSL
jgi:hypothetical protein